MTYDEQITKLDERISNIEHKIKTTREIIEQLPYVADEGWTWGKERRAYRDRKTTIEYLSRSDD